MRRAWLAGAALALGACAVAPAPPERAASSAPASAHRAKTPQGVDLVFDARRRVYAVAGATDRYWVDQRFYRRGPAGWLVATAIDGPWTACASADLPPGLRSEEGR